MKTKLIILAGIIILVVLALVFRFGCKPQPQAVGIVVDTTIFPLNEYLLVPAESIYPQVNAQKLTEIDTTKLRSVMEFGAKGDGKTLDDAAIANALKQSSYGIKFPAGRIYLVSKLSTVALAKDMIVWAYGATIKMADMKRYTFLSMEYKDGNKYKLLWLGGTLDGNKDKQMWPGSPTGNYNWAEAHGRFVGTVGVDFALFKDINLINIVMDGVGLDKVRLGVVSDCTAKDGAPLKYRDVQEQGTYFKATRVGYKTAYFINCVCDGGSIGIHSSYPTKAVMDNQTLTVIDGCKFNNQAQDAVHIEDCAKLFMNNCDVTCNDPYFSESIHISNRTQVVSIKNLRSVNGRFDFANARDLKIGVLDSVRLITNFPLEKMVQNCTHIVRSYFSGPTVEYQTFARYNRQTEFRAWGSKNAVNAASIVDSCRFYSGSVKPVNLRKGGAIYGSIFSECPANSNSKPPSNQDYLNYFKWRIDVYDDKNNYLGNVDCGIKTKP